MAVCFSFLLIVVGLTGIYSITRVSQVSVKAGDSITIPCLYDSQYINHVKYLCKGYYWSSCSYAVKTNQPSSKFSISDDKNKQIFNVTIKNLMAGDTDYYWCAVEIDGGWDVTEYFHVSVSTDTPCLYVDHQDITGFIGDMISIICHSSKSKDIQWCRLGRSCVTGSSQSEQITVTTDVEGHNVFNVSMTGLTKERSGWYLCVKEGSQMPVHLTVTEKPTTTMLSPIAVSGDKTINDTNNQQHSATVDLKSFIIPLTLLIFIVMVALFIWFKLKIHKQSKVKSSANVTAEEEVTYCEVKHKKKTSDQAGRDVTCCTVEHVTGTSRKMPHAETDVDVIYSSVVTTK